MCEDCFESEHKGFTTQTDFENFEKELDKKCWNKNIEILESENEFLDFRMYYKCNTCKESYVMSIPDNAWRGYFLTLDKAIEYHNQIKQSDKKKKYGCLMIFFNNYCNRNIFKSKITSG